MIELWQAIILGIVQGITEWLPISSSGHLVIFQQLFQNIEQPVVFDLFLHIGSLFVVIAVFFNEIKQIALSFFLKEYQEYRKFAYYIILGTIPTALIGLFFRDLFEKAFSSLLSTGTALIITGLLLFFCEGFEAKKRISALSALVIGAMQGLAITPGISRSGTTIAAALFFGTEKREAVRFSFLLFIPAMIGAIILQGKDISINAIEWMPVLVGTLFAIIVGYASLKLLILVVHKRKLRYFSYYCWIVGFIAILLSMKL
jgi:undecaprenyl-diphosphatase